MLRWFGFSWWNWLGGQTWCHNFYIELFWSMQRPCSKVAGVQFWTQRTSSWHELSAGNPQRSWEYASSWVVSVATVAFHDCLSLSFLANIAQRPCERPLSEFFFYCASILHSLLFIYLTLYYTVGIAKPTCHNTCLETCCCHFRLSYLELKHSHI